MDWIELTIRTVSQGIELLCAELTEAGFDGFCVDDQDEFDDFLDSAREYWDYVDDALQQRMQGLSQVRLYLQEPSRLEELRALLAALPERYPHCDFGSLALEQAELASQDWENSWKDNYRPLPVGERLLIVPSWMEGVNPQGRLPILLDLGLTFGTGEHASTQMCLKRLETLIRGGEAVADLGSGSGILSIAALRLGAGRAVGVDIDPAAEHIATENAAANGFGGDCFQAFTGNVTEDDALMERLSAPGYDVVCANIVAPVIISLLPVVPGFLKERGVFLCSGILNRYEQDVRQAIAAAGLTVIGQEHMDEWCCLLAAKGE